MSKIICLDLGNVIFNVDFTEFKKVAASYLGQTEDDINDFLDKSQPLHDMGLTNLVSEIKNYFNIKNNNLSNTLAAGLLKDWEKVIVLEPKTLDFLQDLLNDGIKIFFVSNIGHEHAKQMERIFAQRLSGKYITFFSCYVGARKPSFLYYKTLLEMYPETYDALYIDDLDTNLDAGKKFHFRSHKFELNKSTNLEKDLEIIKKMI